MPEGYDDLGELGLGELHDRNEFLKNQTEALVEGEKARGGHGNINEQAQEFSRKQVSVESEIHDRLAGIHEERSDRARSVDESRRAETAEDPEQWAENPDRFDWPGIDTPR